MGLDTTHGAFHGAYSAFNRFRQGVAKAAGGSFPPHDDKSLDDLMWYAGDFTREQRPGLWEFMSHSDCDGEISPDMCKLVADDLDALLPVMRSMTWQDGGHIGRDGGMIAVTERFIAGCRLAHSQNEPLEFR